MEWQMAGFVFIVAFMLGMPAGAWLCRWAVLYQLREYLEKQNGSD